MRPRVTDFYPARWALPDDEVHVWAQLWRLGGCLFAIVFGVAWLAMMFWLLPHVARMPGWIAVLAPLVVVAVAIAGVVWWGNRE